MAERHAEAGLDGGAREASPSRRMSLGRWFLTWMVVVVVLVLGTAVLLVVVYQRAVLRERLEARGRAVAQSAAMAAAGLPGARLAVSAVPECVAIQVRDAAGAVIWRFGPSPREALRIDPRLVQVARRVRLPGNGPPAWADVEVLLSTAGIRAQLLGIGARLAAALGLVLFLALLVGAALVHQVVQPVARLAAWARTFDPDDPASVEVGPGASREVAELADAFRAMARRIGEQRRSLRESERRFRELFTASPTPLLEVSEDLRVSLANPAVAPYTGCPPGELVGRELGDFFEPAGPGGAGWPPPGGDEASLEGRWRLPGGETAEVELHVRRIKAGDRPFFLVAVHDLTDRVRRLGEEWRRTFDEMVDGVAIVDAEGRIVRANRAIGRHLAAIEPQLTARAATPGRQEWEAGSGDRELRCVLTRPPGADRGILLVRDVTDWMRAEQHLREVQKMEAVATLASGVAHDFNNLVAGILLHVRLLEHDPSSPGALAAIRRLAEEGSRVVDGLLEFSRPERGEPEPVDLGALVAEQEPLLRHLLPANVRLEVRRGTPAARVRGVAGELRRVVLNLVLNARNAIGKAAGRIVVETAVRGTEAILAVEDDGPGIPEEIRDRIFEPFFTVHRGGHGSGLGLAVVYGLVESHGGRIDVATGKAGGVRFVVSFPLEAGGAGPPPAIGA